MAFQFNGQQIYAGKPFVDADGNQYPKNWTSVLSQETKDELGIVWIPDPAPVDTQFYWDYNLPRPLEDEPAVDAVTNEPVFDENGVQVTNAGLKTQWIKEQKDIAGSMLANSDWYVTRKAEVGTEIPADVATYRTAVRTVSGQRETQISEAATFEAFVALVTNQPKVWDETTQAMVDNTEPFLTPWPEEP